MALEVKLNEGFSIRLADTPNYADRKHTEGWRTDGAGGFEAPINLTANEKSYKGELMLNPITLIVDYANARITAYLLPNSTVMDFEPCQRGERPQLKAVKTSDDYYIPHQSQGIRVVMPHNLDELLKEGVDPRVNSVTSMNNKLYAVVGELHGVGELGIKVGTREVIPIFMNTALEGSLSRFNRAYNPGVFDYVKNAKGGEWMLAFPAMLWKVGETATADYGQTVFAILSSRITDLRIAFNEIRAEHAAAEQDALKVA